MSTLEIFLIKKYFKLKKSNFNKEKKKQNMKKYPTPPQRFFSFYNFCTCKF